ncbi:MAG TPA: GntR family transcriptional regulator [Actinobacteria bacterium]|jgi:DNA-binding GntR family transcriptional regulator|nr:GntR family transcriptional regulator [Actinomycetota bacterium]
MAADLLDRDSPDPLYEQLAAILRGRIEAGSITSRLPSETSLMQEYGISRITARKAVEVLAAEGLVRVSHGRGTFVIREPN